MLGEVLISTTYIHWSIPLNFTHLNNKMVLVDDILTKLNKFKNHDSQLLLMYRMATNHFNRTKFRFEEAQQFFKVTDSDAINRRTERNPFAIGLAGFMAGK